MVLSPLQQILLYVLGRIQNILLFSALWTSLQIRVSSSYFKLHLEIKLSKGCFPRSYSEYSSAELTNSHHV